jgi:Protein of unknown function (DUF1643)
MLKPSKRILGRSALFGGEYYSGSIEGWQVAWESVDSHRLWCHQTREKARHLVCVVMFNPGSLSGDGSNLSRDDTLRIVRSAMPDACSVLVVNLFTLAAPNPSDLFDQWDSRQSSAFDITRFQSEKIDLVVYAYGDIGQTGKTKQLYGKHIRQRVQEIADAFKGIPILELPQALISGAKNPKHPKHWKLGKHIPTIKSTIEAFLKANP